VELKKKHEDHSAKFENRSPTDKDVLLARLQEGTVADAKLALNSAKSLASEGIRARCYRRKTAIGSAAPAAFSDRVHTLVDVLKTAGSSLYADIV
jgi:hypothetical protein